MGTNDVTTPEGEKREPRKRARHGLLTGIVIGGVLAVGTSAYSFFGHRRHRPMDPDKVNKHVAFCDRLGVEPR